MSRVTIETIDNIIHYEDAEEVRKLWDIEIVPRKMVEMIIEHCREYEAYNKSTGRFDVAAGVCFVSNYAESLLKQFEDDGEV